MKTITTVPGLFFNCNTKNQLKNAESVDKFNEVNFKADVDILVRELRENKTDRENLCEIESSAK